MIGSNYGYNTVVLSYGYSGRDVNGWSASVDFYDAGFCNDDPAKDEISTEGTLRTRYRVRDVEGGRPPAIVAFESLVADLERLGMVVSLPELAISVRHADDGEDLSDIPVEELKVIQTYARTFNYELYMNVPEFS